MKCDCLIFGAFNYFISICIFPLDIIYLVIKMVTISPQIRLVSLYYIPFLASSSSKNVFSWEDQIKDRVSLYECVCPNMIFSYHMISDDVICSWLWTWSWEVGCRISQNGGKLYQIKTYSCGSNLAQYRGCLGQLGGVW